MKGRLTLKNTLGALARLVLAAVFLAATQFALVHSAHNVKQQVSVGAPHAQDCGVCFAAGTLGSGVSLGASALSVLACKDDSQTSRQTSFVAAFAPLFRSQAPPALS